MKIGDLCPECGDSVPFGQAAVANEKGCTGNVCPECYACGYSECWCFCRYGGQTVIPYGLPSWRNSKGGFPDHVPLLNPKKAMWK